MKERSIVAITLLTTVMCVASCRVVHHAIRSPTLEQIRLLSSCRNTTSQNELTVQCGTLTEPRGFFVGNYLGTGFTEVVSLLTNAKIAEIVLEFENSLPVATSNSYLALLETQGIRVIEIRSPVKNYVTGIGISGKPSAKYGHTIVLIGTLAGRGRHFVGVSLPNKVSETTALLQSLNAHRIVFMSDFKWPPEAVSDFREKFVLSGIEITAFWCPSSNAPGGFIDWMKEGI